jgi:hypothetical protein
MKAWFGPKRVGFGISPCSWEGWAAIAVYAGGIYGIIQWLPLHYNGLEDAQTAAIWLWSAVMLAAAFLTFSRTPHEPNTTLADRYLR